MFDNENDYKQHKIHIILGAGDIARIKEEGMIRERAGEPIAENTSFGWFLMGQGDKSSKIGLYAG